jgi:Ca-activated chloride channel family protein
LLYNWFSHINFLHPYFFVLLLIIPVVIYWYVYVSANQKTGITSSRVIQVNKNWKYYLWHLPFIFRILALLCVIIALARPQLRNAEEFKTGAGIDIILCMDVSGSMFEKDLVPNRLEASKKVAMEFVEKRPTDRIGLVKFSREGFALVPLTTDHNLVVTQIAIIEKGVLDDGTAIGDGLGVSIDRLRQATGKSKIIVLLTDGADQGGLIDPLTAVEMAKSFGIKIYTVGVGSKAQTIQREPSASGSKVSEPINEELLSRISNETGGLYFRATDNASLSSIYNEINQLEKSPYEVKTFTRVREMFFPWAVAAVVLLFLELLLRTTFLKKLP